MVLHIVSKVPHVQGKSEETMSALMAQRPSLFVYGDEKFCIIRNLPGFCGLGTMAKGEV